MPFVAVLTPVPVTTPGAMTASESVAFISSYSLESSSILSSRIGYGLYASSIKSVVSKAHLSSIPVSKRYPFSSLSSKSYPSSSPISSSYSSPQRSRSYSPPSSIPLSSAISPSSLRSSVSSLYSYPRKIYAPSTAIIPIKGVQINKRMPRGYSVFGRRFGVFKPLGVARTEAEAFRIGKKFAGTTLGVTFKIPGISGRKLKGFTTKYTKQGILYIEPRGRRLKRGSGEVPEINLYRSKRRSKR
jgi:hypothetical protein